MTNKNIVIFFLLSAILFHSTQFLVYEAFSQSEVNSENVTVSNNATTIISGVNGPISGSTFDSVSTHNFSDWNIISGNWNISPQLLEGTTDNSFSGPVDNIIINPTVLNDFSRISTTFTINEMERNLTNYANIVYSYIDAENFKKAGMYVFDDNVFVRFAEIENGSVIPQPLHPYINTDLKWVPGNSFNLTVNFQDDVQSLVLNGTQYAGKIDPSVDGLTGLNYGRISNIAFNNFEVKSNNAPNQNIESRLAGAEPFVIGDSQFIMLGEKTLPSDSLIHLYDSSPLNIITAHITANLPCDENNVTDVQILAGDINEITELNLTPVPEFSDPGNLCQYITDISTALERTNMEIFIQNNSTDDLEFPSMSSVIINVKELARISQ